MNRTSSSEGTPQIVFRAGHLLEYLNARGRPLAGVAKRDLTRYYALLLYVRGSLPVFTDDEERAIDEGLALVHPYFPAMGIPVRDPALEAKLSGLTVVQRLALVDGLEQRRFELVRVGSMSEENRDTLD